LRLTYNVQMLSFFLRLIGPEIKCRLWACKPDLQTSTGSGLVLGCMLKVRVRVRVSISIWVNTKVRVSSSILP